MTLDVVCLGEALAVFSPDPPAPIVEGTMVRVGVAGAETNVADGLARLGIRTGWHGRLGADPFGAMILKRLVSAGVSVDSVEIDPTRPTGIYVKDPASRSVHYRRSNSAASIMDELTLDRLAAAPITHISGITAALSASCLRLLRHILDGSRRGVVSFDVNYRPALWTVSQAAPILLELAQAADLVLVGRDEAEALWGTTSADEIRAHLSRPRTLVVKDGDIGATAFIGDDVRVFEAAPKVEVVEPVGAGDAFAAGYLAGVVRGFDPSKRLRLGHRLAARALRSAGDLGVPPSTAELDAWGLRSGPAST
ncbi:sugar kinase [Stackebrandtia soli]|uniref:sugar kinase n=1 Tax=Stackebrandtia soli TaxID=1892856 RepID=UPI0039E8CC11